MDSHACLSGLTAGTVTGAASLTDINFDEAAFRTGEASMLRHVAMFRWKDDATVEQKNAARDAAIGMLGKVPTLRAITAGHDIRRNPNNWDMVLVADFDDVKALEAYFAHPVMNATSDLIASVTKKELTARIQIIV
jgi:hypothetical protein